MIYLDTSVVVALLTPEERSSQALGRLVRYMALQPASARLAFLGISQVWTESG